MSLSSSSSSSSRLISVKWFTVNNLFCFELGGKIIFGCIGLIFEYLRILFKFSSRQFSYFSKARLVSSIGLCDAVWYHNDKLSINNSILWKTSLLVGIETLILSFVVWLSVINDVFVKSLSFVWKDDKDNDDGIDEAVISKELLLLLL